MFEQHETEMERKLEERPLCERCEEPIQDDFYYDIGGEIYCEDCMVSCFRKVIEYWDITEHVHIVVRILILGKHVIARKKAN